MIFSQLRGIMIGLTLTWQALAGDWCINPSKLPCGFSSKEEALRNGSCSLNSSFYQDKVPNFSSLGGYVQKTASVSTYFWPDLFNVSWVNYPYIGINAQICDQATILERAMVYEQAIVSGKSVVTDNARVYGQAQIAEEAKVSKKAQVYDQALVSGKARVTESAKVYGKAKIIEEAKIYNYSQVYGHAEVSGFATVNNQSKIYENAKLTDSSKVHGSTEVYGNARLSEYASASGVAHLSGDRHLSGYDRITLYRGAETATYLMKDLSSLVYRQLGSLAPKQDLLSFLPPVMEGEQTDTLVNLISSVLQEDSNPQTFYAKLFFALNKKLNCHMETITLPSKTFNQALGITQEEIYQALINSCLVRSIKLTKLERTNRRLLMGKYKHTLGTKLVTLPQKIESHFEFYQDRVFKFNDIEFLSRSLRVEHENLLVSDAGGARRQFLSKVVSEFSQFIDSHGLPIMKKKDPEILGKLFARLLVIEQSLVTAPFGLPPAFYQFLLEESHAEAVARLLASDNQLFHQVKRASSLREIRETLHLHETEDTVTDGLYTILGLSQNENMTRFKKGFFSALDLDGLKKLKLTPDSFKELVEGDPLTLAKLKSVITSENEELKDSFIKAFEEIYDNIAELDLYEGCLSFQRKKLLQQFATFTTGNDHLDIDLVLKANLEIKPNSLPFIIAHTCQGGVDCPEELTSNRQKEAIINSLKTFKIMQEANFTFTNF